MSLIYCKLVGFRQYRLFCESCQSEVAIVEWQELRDLSHKGIKVFCFDCDGVGKDEMPEIFRWEGEPYWLEIGGNKFLVDWPRSAREQSKRAEFWQVTFKNTLQELADSKVASSTLSSSTELHKNSEEEGYNGSK